jgi:hypothetical protein
LSGIEQAEQLHEGVALGTVHTPVSTGLAPTPKGHQGRLHIGVAAGINVCRAGEEASVLGLATQGKSFTFSSLVDGVKDSG